jgi:hypothetical protein
MSGPGRQRLATWILTRCTSDYMRDALIGDLLELYEERGSWWYWRQILGAVRAHPVRLLWSAVETRVPAAAFIDDLVIGVALGMCGLIQLPIYALLFIGWTPMTRSESSIVIVSTLIGAALIAAATTVHEIRMRTPAGLLT